MSERNHTLFDDLEDDWEEDTLESLLEERKERQGQVSAFDKALASVRADNKKLLASLDEVKSDLEKAKKKLAQDSRATTAKFLSDLQPVFDALQAGLTSLENEKANDAKFDKLVEGIEKTLSQLSTVFNKHAARPETGAAPTEEAKSEAAPAEEETAQTHPEEAPESTIESLRAECDALEEKIISLGNTLGRAQADQTTLTARVAEAKAFLARDIKQLEEDAKFGLEKCFKDMLCVVDTLDIGLQAIRKDKSGEAKVTDLREKIETTLGNLKAVFNVYGISEIDPVHEAFDENKHEVISVQPITGFEPETVVHVHQKGYALANRLIRPAKVVVTPAE